MLKFNTIKKSQNLGGKNEEKKIILGFAFLPTNDKNIRWASANLSTRTNEE